LFALSAIAPQGETSFFTPSKTFAGYAGNSIRTPSTDTRVLGFFETGNEKIAKARKCGPALCSAPQFQAIVL